MSLTLVLQSTDAQKNTHALWGKFAANILDQEWEEAHKDLMSLKEFIDGTTTRTVCQYD